jgi:glycerol-3-phosphate cytidylyltransferase-like family protein
MRQWLKHDEKWKEWENMEMKWIHHHNPDVVVLDDGGREKTRLDLQGWTAAKLEKFLEDQGAKRR